jgi:hypothetical protein
MEKVETDIAGVGQRLGNVEIDVGATRADVQTVVRRFDSLETTIPVAERLTDLEHQVAELRRQARWHAHRVNWGGMLSFSPIGGAG